MKYTRGDIRQIVDLAFRGAMQDEKLQRELGLDHYKIEEKRALLESPEVLRGLDILFNAIYPRLDEENLLFQTADKYPLEYLDLSSRSFAALTRSGVRTVADLLRMTEDELCRVRSVGKKSAAEIRERRDQFIENFENGCLL